MGRKLKHDVMVEDLLELIEQVRYGVSIPYLLNHYGVPLKQPHRKRGWEAIRYLLNGLVRQGKLNRVTDDKGNVKYYLKGHKTDDNGRNDTEPVRIPG